MVKSAHQGVQPVLLGTSELGHGGAAVQLSLGAHRLLSFLALQDAGAQRAAAAEALWPNHRAGRAAANLRSALCQARRVGTTTVIERAGQRISLAPGVQLDKSHLARYAHQIMMSPDPAVGLTGHDEVVEGLSRELLPDWSDDWVVLERERWDQLRLHALETLARWLIKVEKYMPALEVALTAVAIEPVRESAHRTVIEVHIAEGNSACAISYRGLLQRELGVLPSQRMDRLIRSLGWV